MPTRSSVLGDLDEAVTITEDALSAASSVLEEIGIGEILDGIATALKSLQQVYKEPLNAIQTVDRDTIKKVEPTLNDLHTALQNAQKDLTLASEELPQFARTVELVGALTLLLQAVVSAFPDGDASSPGGRLRALMDQWTTLRNAVEQDASAVSKTFAAIKADVAPALAAIDGVFKDAEQTIAGAVAPVQNLVAYVEPWGEKVHHAIDNITPLKWAMKMAAWLGKAVDWLLDQISLGSLLSSLGKAALDPFLKALHLDGIAEKISSGLPGESDLARHLGTLNEVPKAINTLKVNLAGYKTGQAGNPIIPLIQEVLGAITGTDPTDTPDAVFWTPPPSVTQETATEAVSNRMTYVSRYQTRGAMFTACFEALGQLADKGAGGGTRLEATVTLRSSSPSAASDAFPPPAPLGPDWSGLTALRAAADHATPIVTPGETDVATLEAALAAFSAQAALAPLLQADMADLSELWQDVATVAGNVKSVATGTGIDALLQGFLQGLSDQVAAAQKLSEETQRFQQNAAALGAIVQQADVALRMRFSNAVSHHGDSYVDALVARYGIWGMETNTLPRAFDQLRARDTNNAHGAEIAALQAKVNAAGQALTAVLNTTANDAVKVQQSVANLVAELRTYGASAGALAGPVTLVRGHL